MGSRQQEESRGERWLRPYVEMQAVGGVLSLLLYFVGAVVLLWQGRYLLGGALLGMLLVAAALAFSVSRKTPRNPHRHQKAKRARAARRAKP